MSNIWHNISALLYDWQDLQAGDLKAWQDMMLTPVPQLYADFKNLPVSDCKLILEKIDKQISQHSEPDRLRRHFFLTFVAEMVSTKTVHGNLCSCEKLIEEKVRSFLDQLKIDGAFPTLTSDDGAVPLLIFSGKFIPLLNYHAEINGIYRGVFFRMNWFDKVRSYKYVLFRMKGFYPVLEYHMQKTKNKKFTKELLFDDYLVTAELLKKNSILKGAFQTNWYIDPQLVNVTPHLGELGMMASKYGSLVVCLGEDEKVIQDATHKSSKRLRLYKDGLYKPMRYARFWSRKDIMFFSDSYKNKEVEELFT
jgi:hypothetical protein